MRPPLRPFLRMRRPALASRLVGPLLLTLLAAPAGALTLTVDPAQSAITPQSGGGAQTLSGSLDVVLGDVPVVANTTFDVTALALTASGGAQIDLDPGAPSPGLGVVTPSGSVLLGTLFLRIQDGGETTLLAIPDVPGQAEFGPSGGLSRLSSAFTIDAGEAGLLDVSFVAVPEPGLALLLLGALALARRTLQPRELS